MTQLAKLQEQFQAFILSGHASIYDSVISTESVSSETRLNIYRDAYRLRLIECLTSTFTALHLYLGTEAFEQLCTDFIKTHPSSYRSIRWYGDDLAEYVRDYYEKPYAFLAELTDFEWKMTLAFDAKDEPVLAMQDMALVHPNDWANMRFTVHPSVLRVNYFWNAIPLWQTLIADEDIPLMQADSAIKPWLIWRTPDLIIQFYSMSQEEAWMLDALAKGHTFAHLCEGLCEWLESENVAMTAASYLKNWIQKGILTSII